MSGPAVSSPHPPHTDADGSTSAVASDASHQQPHAGPSHQPQTPLSAGLTDPQAIQRFLLAQQAMQGQQRQASGSSDAAQSLSQGTPDFAAMAKAVGGVQGMQGASKDAIMKQASSLHPSRVSLTCPVASASDVPRCPATARLDKLSGRSWPQWGCRSGIFPCQWRRGTSTEWILFPTCCIFTCRTFTPTPLLYRTERTGHFLPH